jgi:ferredoxin-NADP reductase/MOSC domain-containing protein YiiM
MVRTGIFKKPVEGRIMARTLNLDGDGQADLVGHVGDRFHIGTALFEVSQPRVPCYKLAMKMGVEGFYAQLLKSGRPGFYFRVLEEGEVGAGDEIRLVDSDPVGMTAREVSNLLYFEKDDLDGARNVLRIKALSPGWVRSFETRLAKAEVGSKAHEQFRTLVVSQKVPESENVTSFYLVPEDASSLDPFLPGQFLPLKLDIPGQYQPILRTYSLSDAPQKNYYRLTIKRESAPPNQPDAYPGVSSSYFHDQVEVGAKLLAKAPRGRFVMDPQAAAPVVLLSAGVGLTPLISMLNAIVESGSRRPTWFIHGSRDGRVHAMGESVREIARVHDHIHAHIRYSRPAAEDLIGRDYDDQGHVDAALVRQLIPETNRDCDFYLCGPTAFLKSLFDGLREWGIPEHRIHYEFFGPASALKDRERVSGPKRRAGASECREEIEVTFSRSGVTANWNPSLESILDLAEANGLSPDYSCRSGVCQTCVSDLQEGEVEYVLEPLDPPDPGSVLICCSKPKTNVVVDV